MLHTNSHQEMKIVPLGKGRPWPLDSHVRGATPRLPSSLKWPFGFSTWNRETNSLRYALINMRRCARRLAWLMSTQSKTKTLSNSPICRSAVHRRMRMYGMDQCPASAAHTGQTGGTGDQWFLCSASVVGQREVRSILHAGSRAEVGHSLDPIPCPSDVQRLPQVTLQLRG
jgi:hypothetical protein